MAESIRKVCVSKDIADGAIESAGYHVGALVKIEDRQGYKRVWLHFGYDDRQMIRESVEDFELFAKEINQNYFGGATA